MIWLLGYLALGCLAAGWVLSDYKGALTEVQATEEELPGWLLGSLVALLWPVMLTIEVVSVISDLLRRFRG